MSMRLPVAAVALAVLASGCATKRDLRDLRDEVAALREAQLETLRDIRAQNAAILDTLSTQDLRLRGDLTNQLAQVERQIARLEELTGEGQQRLAELARNRPAAEPPTGAPPSAEVGDADELLAAAADAFERGSYNTARAAYEEFLRAYPRHARAPDAQIGIGDTHARTNNRDAAVQAYGRVLELYPDSPRAATALLRAADIERERGNRDRSRALLNQLVAAYPDSPEAATARQRLR